jgi:hypothetical protein
MSRLLVSSFVLALVAWTLPAQGQTPGVDTLTAPLSPASEVPPITDLNAGGDGIVRIHTQLASDGVLSGATVEFRLDYILSNEQVISAMHIHSGVAGENGPVVVDSEFGDPVIAGPGTGTELRTVTITDPAVLDTIGQILANPAGFYFNVHSEQFPNGFARGQLQQPSESELDLIQDLKVGQSALSGQLTQMQELIERIAVRVGVIPNVPDATPPPVEEPPSEEPPVEEPPAEEPPAEEPPPAA